MSTQHNPWIIIHWAQLSIIDPDCEIFLDHLGCNNVMIPPLPVPKSFGPFPYPLKPSRLDTSPLCDNCPPKSFATCNQSLCSYINKKSNLYMVCM